MNLDIPECPQFEWHSILSKNSAEHETVGLSGNADTLIEKLRAIFECW